MQAIILQMAAAQTFGDAELRQARRDHGVDGASGRDGHIPVRRRRDQQPLHLAAVHPERAGKDGHHQSAELGRRARRTISFNVVATTSKFYNENPRLYAVFMKSLAEATEFINRDKRGAAEIYIKMTKDKSPVEDILKIINDPQIEYSLVPSEHHEDGRLHAQDWDDQGEAGFVEGALLRQHARVARELMKPQGDNSRRPLLSPIVERVIESPCRPARRSTAERSARAPLPPPDSGSA